MIKDDLFQFLFKLLVNSAENSHAFYNNIKAFLPQIWNIFPAVSCCKDNCSGLDHTLDLSV